MPGKPINLTAAVIDAMAIQEPDKLLALLENKQTHDHVWELVATYGNDPLCADCASPIVDVCPCTHKGLDGLDVSE